jgi:transketolase
MENDLLKLKKIIVESAYKAGEGHIASAFSILDILWVLYDKILKIDPEDPNNKDRDRFILSKGHASLGLYAILANKGFFPFSEFDNFGKYKSILGGHPNLNKIPGVEASTGSLGHGFPMAVGMAMGLKISKSDNRVYCLVGDGEANEGTIWESAMLAAHHELSNLCLIIDHNHSTDRALVVCDLAEKFKSFGWESSTIDGHDQKKIYQVLNNLNTKKPTAVIAETIKGQGVKMMEKNPAWHHKFPSDDELKEIMNELS